MRSRAGSMPRRTAPARSSAIALIARPVRVAYQRSSAIRTTIAKRLWRKRAAEYARAHGMQVVMDLDVRLAGGHAEFEGCSLGDGAGRQ